DRARDAGAGDDSRDPRPRLRRARTRAAGGARPRQDALHHDGLGARGGRTREDRARQDTLHRAAAGRAATHGVRRRMIAIREFRTADAEHWDRYVLGARGSHFAQRTPWREVVARAYGVTPLWYLAEMDGRVIGVLPLFAKRVGTLFSSPGGLLADDINTAKLLLVPARLELQKRRGTWIELRDQKRAWPELATVEEHVTMELELAPT